jgi:hypothetical protein
VRRALVALSALGAAAALVVGARQTWPNLAHARVHDTAAQAEVAAAVHEGLPVAQFRRWKAQLHKGDRWWLEVPAGAAEGLTDRGGVYRAFATYYFLPAVPASSRADATVVFRLRSAR